jgi:hypothetical protein
MNTIDSQMGCATIAVGCATTAAEAKVNATKMPKTFFIESPLQVSADAESDSRDAGAARGCQPFLRLRCRRVAKG